MRIQWLIITRTSLILALGVVGGGCATTSMFDTDGTFRHPAYGYSLPESAVSSADWILDNYRRSRGNLVAKQGTRYAYQLELDDDDDGIADARVPMQWWDLHYQHRRDSSEMWVTTRPVAQRFRDTELRVLARRYVEGVSGEGIGFVRLGQLDLVTSRRYATRALSEREMFVGAFPAYEVIFEVANLDQVELDADARWERARIVIVRPGFYFIPRSAGDTSDLLPVVMTLGYSSFPEDFAAHTAEFDRLLSEITLIDPAIAQRMDELRACFDGAPQGISLVVPSLAILTPEYPSAEQRDCVRRVLRGVRFGLPRGVRRGSRAVPGVPSRGVSSDAASGGTQDAELDVSTPAPAQSLQPSSNGAPP
jgi:hypothetical protein